MELEEYRQPQETGPHWEMRKEFLQYYKDFLPEDRLLCLAQVYANIELLQCSYPPQVMKEVQRLADHLKGGKIIIKTEKFEPVEDPDQKKNTSKRKVATPQLQAVKKSKNEDLEESTEEEGKKSEDLPSGAEFVHYKSIVQAENFDVIEKLSAEVIKLSKLDKENAYDTILSAALNINMEDAIDLKYTKHSTPEAERFCCELFVGATKLSAGCGENRYAAKKEASERALDTLSNLSLIEKLGDELKKEKDALRAANDNLIAAALHLGMEHLLDYKFLTKTVQSAKSGYLGKRFRCEFFVGATKISEAVDYYKHTVKRKAAQFAIVFLTRLKDSGNTEVEEHVFDKDEDESEASQISSYSDKYNKDLLEKMAFVIKKLSVKNALPLHAASSCFNYIGRPDDLSYNIYKDVSNPKVPMYICDALVNKIPVVSGKAVGRKKAKKVAAENLVNLFLDLFDRKRKASDASEDIYADVILLFNQQPPPETPKKTHPEEDSFTTAFLSGLITDETPNDEVQKQILLNLEKSKHPRFLNKRLYYNSIKLNLLLFDYSLLTVGHRHHQLKWAFGSLCKSVTTLRRSITSKCTPLIDDTFRAELILDNKTIGSGIGKNKIAAKEEASRLLTERLQKQIYTIKVLMKDQDCYVITTKDLNMLKFDTKSRKIICPGNETFTKMIQYYAGFVRKVHLDSTQTIIEKLLEGYSKSNALDPLVFSERFPFPLKTLIYKTALTLKLAKNKYKRCDDHNIYIKRKVNVRQILDALAEAGGKRDKYELVDRSK